MTLPDRRAALKRLLASGETSIDAYEEVLEGASEKDRRCLFKSVPFARLVPPAVERDEAVPEDTVCMCAFLRAALAGSDEAGDDYGARWLGRSGGDPREGADLERLLAAHRRGAAGRSGEWLEEAAGSPGGVGFWHTYRSLLAERGAYLASAPSLEYFARRIIPAPHPTSDETRLFFEENPTFLDHEFWQFFRVEGALPGSALFVWMYREDPSAPGGDFERLHSQDLICYVATHLPDLRPRILSECLAAQRRDFSAYNARAFSLAWEALEPTREETLEAVVDLIALLAVEPSPSVALAQKALLGIARELTDEQAGALVQASAQVLARSEKKLLRAHLRLLAALVKAHPECAPPSMTWLLRLSSPLTCATGPPHSSWPPTLPMTVRTRPGPRILPRWERAPGEEDPRRGPRPRGRSRTPPPPTCREPSGSPSCPTIMTRSLRLYTPSSRMLPRVLPCPRS